VGKNKSSIHTRKLHKLSQRNRRVSAPLSPIFSLFLVPSGKLYQKLQYLLAEDDKAQRSTPLIIQHRRPGPKRPKYSIPAEHWTTVLQHMEEQLEPLRTVAAVYGVTDETIRRLLHHVHQLRGQQ
jgi:hypothetical protein